ncbi:MAG: hypothetical protein QM808_00715 [Steroidobacteraceae bacterium]
MRKSSLFTTWCLIPGLLLCFAANVRAEASGNTDLTPTELKWLRAGWPVLTYADQQHLPVDIVVQPRATANDAPLAMGVSNGRCQLVLSMRGNPEAETILTTLPAELQTIAIEAMTAHELAHCWRYLNGSWHALPAGFVEVAQDADDQAELLQAMRLTRREEGFADLVGLAWTLREHPKQYAAIHTWFEQVRADQPVTGSFHDTRSWLQLAAKPTAFAVQGTPFEQARQLWSQGLLEQ